MRRSTEPKTRRMHSCWNCGHDEIVRVYPPNVGFVCVECFACGTGIKVNLVDGETRFSAMQRALAAWNRLSLTMKVKPS